MNNILTQTYEEFIGQFEVYFTQKLARAKGYEAHHIIPKAVQKKEKGEVYDDRCVRLTNFEHILAHYLYCKEYPNIEEEYFALMSMTNKRAKNLLEYEEKFLEELPYLAEMKKRGRESIYTDERRNKISKANSNPSDETRRKISLAHKGKILSEEHKKKLSYAHKGKTAWNAGKKMSEEYRNKLSESHKGQIVSQETRNKLSKALKGHKPAKQTIEKSIEARSKKVYQYDLENNLIQIFPSVTETAKILGKSRSTIINYLKEKIPKKLCYRLSYN